MRAKWRKKRVRRLKRKRRKMRARRAHRITMTTNTEFPLSPPARGIGDPTTTPPLHHNQVENYCELWEKGQAMGWSTGIWQNDEKQARLEDRWSITTEYKMSCFTQHGTICRTATHVHDQYI
ncbi:hypothetical protein F4775DRAFT_593171 [Biscogniauxia sp. FL1348]|nr:hypothetical protein F4775DRAFT_593171 [Biscogniauxia sp. FL1348]